MVYPKVVRGRDVPSGARVVHRVGDGPGDWEVEALPDPAVVLDADEEVVLLDDGGRWPSAPMVRVLEGVCAGVAIAPGTVLTKFGCDYITVDAHGRYLWVRQRYAGDSLTVWEDVEVVPTVLLAELDEVVGEWDSAIAGGERPDAHDLLLASARAVTRSRGGDAS